MYSSFRREGRKRKRDFVLIYLRVVRTKQNGKIEFSDTSMGSNEIIKVKETNESVIMKIERNPRSFPSLFKTLALFLFFFKYPKKIQETKSLLIYFLSLSLSLSTCSDRKSVV